MNRLYWIGSVAVAAILFGLLANQHWVPGGDSEVYVSTARNLVLHHFSMHGYLFNGQPLTISPPGWPYILAVAMKLSTRFWFLKFILLLSMVGSLAIAYPTCRRFAPPGICAAAIVGMALTSHVFPLTFWLHSDAMFCLFTSASFLVALQIGEGKTSTWRIIFLCVLCFAANTVRYAGPFNWVIIAPALLQHQRWPIKNIWTSASGRRALIAVFASFVVTAATFTGWHLLLRVNEQQALLIQEAGGGEDTGIDLKADPMARRQISLLNSDEKGIKGYLVRPLLIGNWYSILFWQPFRFGVLGWLNILSLVFGWLVLWPMIALAIHEAKRRKFFWAGVLLYGIALAMLWPHPNARYLVPITFLLLIGLWRGSLHIADVRPSLRRWMNGALITFVIGFLLCNGTLYGVEVWAERSSDFYSAYEAGLNRDLISACDWIIAHHLPPNERIAVSERYVNLSKVSKRSYLGLRVTTMLTGRPIMELPLRYLKNKPTTMPSTTPDYLLDPDPMDNDFFLLWARKNGVKYFLYQPPVSPWRALHFRVPWIQERATHEKVVDTGAGWRLYRVPRDRADRAAGSAITGHR